MNKIEASNSQQVVLPDVSVLNDLPTDGITCLQYLPQQQQSPEKVVEESKGK